MNRAKYIAFGLLFFIGASANAEDCPAINCDCDALPSDSWIKACRSHEANIRTTCVNNDNQPTQYCAVHGPDAYPLPLAIRINPQIAVEEAEIASLEEQIAAMYWAVHTDSDNVFPKRGASEMDASLHYLKSINSYIDNLFDTQHKVEASWLAVENPKKAANAWRKYATDNLDVGQDLRALGLKLLNESTKVDMSDTSRKLETLGSAALKISAKAFEMAGYAFAKSSRFGRAARAWQDAAKVSQTLVVQIEQLDGDSSQIQFLNFQSAARYNRASYYWLLSEGNRDAMSAIEQSKSLVAEQEKEILETLLMEEDRKLEDAKKNNGILNLF